GTAPLPCGKDTNTSACLDRLTLSVCTRMGAWSDLDVYLEISSHVISSRLPPGRLRLALHDLLPLDPGDAQVFLVVVLERPQIKVADAPAARFFEDLAFDEMVGVVRPQRIAPSGLNDDDTAWCGEYLVNQPMPAAWDAEDQRAVLHVVRDAHLTMTSSSSRRSALRLALPRAESEPA